MFEIIMLLEKTEIQEFLMKMEKRIFIRVKFLNGGNNS